MSHQSEEILTEQVDEPDGRDNNTLFLSFGSILSNGSSLDSRIYVRCGASRTGEKFLQVVQEPNRLAHLREQAGIVIDLDSYCISANVFLFRLATHSSVNGVELIDF